MERKMCKKDKEGKFKIIRNNSIRRRRCLSQILFGLLLGLLLGFLINSNILIDLGLNYNQSCSFSVEYTNRPKKEKEETPLSIIKMDESTVNTHNSQQTLVFVGVMTAQKYLQTRAVAVYETWGQELPGRIAFFSSFSSTVPNNRLDLPLVRLNNVDDSYPPQKKSFMMLQYMWENYADKFEWFIRADDDVYIRSDKLEQLLRSVDSKKVHFIGQAGRGNQEEFGLLSLEYDENFCMGGPGIIMSREVLSRIAPHIKYCLKNLYTTHEDVELGRCVRKFAQVSCTWSYEMQNILYHNSSGYEAFQGSLKLKEIHRAITLHPIKRHENMYRIHDYMKGLKIQELQQETILLHRDINRMNAIIGSKGTNDGESKLGDVYTLGDTVKLGQEPGLNKFKTKSERHVLTWDFLQRSLFSLNNYNPRRRMESGYREGLGDVVREVMETINRFSRQRGRVIEYQDLLYGYMRVDPIHGPDYILDMLLKYKKYRGRKMTVPVRRHAYLQQQFVGLEIREINDNKAEDLVINNMDVGTIEDNDKKLVKDIMEGTLMKINEYPNSETTERTATRTKINFIVPLYGRNESFHKFIQNFEKVCLKQNENVELIMVVFQNSHENNMNYIIEKINHLKLLYPTKNLKIIPLYEEFARAKALDIGVKYSSNDPHALLFFIDVDIIFKKETLVRIRLNTIYNKQVYFPIVFSQFDPNIIKTNNILWNVEDEFVISAETGYWRQFGFGILSVYKDDLTNAGGFNTSIKGWGKEDVDLYDKFIGSNLNVFRTVDPTLIHRFHTVSCDPNLESSQWLMCTGTKTVTFGSKQQLGNLIYKKYNDVLNFVRTRRKNSPII